LPETNALANRLSGNSPRLALKGELHWSGLMPVTFDDKETGFELRLSPVTSSDLIDYEKELAESGEEDDGFLSILQGSDCQITVACNDDVSIAAGKAFSLAIASLSGGHVCDPQTGRTERAA
jgi:hypothetical protein